MANLLVMNDNNLALSAMQMANGGAPINDAVLVAHFFDPNTTGSIVGVTNTGPIQITTSAAHGLSTGQQVVIAHVTGDVAANGCWTITVTGPTTFTLNGSVGGGAYDRAGDWYLAIANGTFLDLAYQAGSAGNYVTVVPYTIDRINGEQSRCIIFCANYNYQLERDHTSMIRT